MNTQECQAHTEQQTGWQAQAWDPVGLSLGDAGIGSPQVSIRESSKQVHVAVSQAAHGV